MGLYNFKPRFVPMILNGTKSHTIRAPRKHPDQPGDTMHLYEGLRTKQACLLFRAPCLKVEEIEIGVRIGIRLDGEILDLDEANALAWRDGFRESFDDNPANGHWGSLELMLRFWQRYNELPFKGQIYHWDYAKRTT